MHQAARRRAATGWQQQKGSQRAQEAQVDSGQREGGREQGENVPIDARRRKQIAELTQQSIRKRIEPAAIAEETAEGWNPLTQP